MKKGRKIALPACSSLTHTLAPPYPWPPPTHAPTPVRRRQSPAWQPPTPEPCPHAPLHLRRPLPPLGSFIPSAPPPSAPSASTFAAL